MAGQDRASRRVVDDARLAGLWLRHAFSESVFTAPVRLPDGAAGLVEVVASGSAGPRRRVVRWLLFDRHGARDGGELDPPALAVWQALAHVERVLQERGVRLDGRDQARE